VQTFSATAALVLVIATMACASSSGSNESGQQTATPSSRRSNDVMTEQELRESTVLTALDAVRQHRPTWLRGRGATSMGTQAEPVVYYADLRMGGVQSLSQFNIGGIKELRYFNATEATNRWGTGHSAGAILVVPR